VFIFEGAGTAVGVRDVIIVDVAELYGGFKIAPGSYSSGNSDSETA